LNHFSYTKTWIFTRN